ncbi:MAG TPA: M12 family metallo-peptidase [Phycisphaerales bacterium]|nr:M12 family metallo-peptidase [Phycisphaerales bacterium]
MNHRLAAGAFAACLLAAAPAAEAQPSTRFRVDESELTGPGGRVSLRVQLPGAGDVSLDLTPFSVTTEQTRFVVGDGAGEDVELAFDPRAVVLLRGGVEGDARSHAFLSAHEGAMSGRIELGSGERFVVTSRAAGGRALGPGEALVLPDTSRGGSLPGCGVAAPGPVEGAWDGPGRAAGRPGVILVEAAVETDYELYEQFRDLDDEAAYIVQLYGAVSDVYLRDVGATIALTFVRLWDTPDDLFNQEEPLSHFRDYWEVNMDHVQRDTAQFLSGRVDLPWGGVAYVSGACGRSGYSVAGYILGHFADPDEPSSYSRDPVVAAHELGHNLGTYHTHDYGIDDCDDPFRPAQRGTIMAYCGQTHSGGEANHDFRFHTFTAGEIREFLEQAACVDDDANLNGVPDDEDIGGGTSDDANGNGVPDESEDCNGNGVLDPQDISDGSSADVNSNGVPDECEPDCNGNGLPDGHDIAEGTSPDRHGDGVPDECETDCDGDGASDYTEICAEMSLDLDRDARLDGCEDCDGDGAADLVSLDGAHDVWVADKVRPVLRRFLSQTGTVVRDSGDAGLAEPGDVLALPDGRVLATSMLDDRVVQFGRGGGLLGDLVGPGGGGLSEPGAMCLSTWGPLLVASAGTDSVKAYDAASGAYLGDHVGAGAGGLARPFGLAVTREGSLAVTSADGRILEFDLGTGAFVRELVSIAGNGGLSDPRGLLALPDGRLLAASRGTDQVLEFDGATGAFLRQFNRGGTASRMTMDEPWCLRLGPEGGVYVSRAHDHERPAPGKGVRPGGRGELHLTNARIYHFHPTTGKLIRAYVQSVDSGLEHPTGFDFLRDGGADCNLNLVPDACDIAMGTSQDADGDGVPDECRAGCRADYDGNGLADTRDVIAYLDDWVSKRPGADTNGDVVIDIRDFIAFLNAWASGC